MAGRREANVDHFSLAAVPHHVDQQHHGSATSEPGPIADWCVTDLKAMRRLAGLPPEYRVDCDRTVGP
jgi:hypothetical protein